VNKHKWVVIVYDGTQKCAQIIGRVNFEASLSGYWTPLWGNNPVRGCALEYRSKKEFVARLVFLKLSGYAVFGGWDGTKQYAV